MNLYFMSFVVVLVNPISAGMLAHLIVSHKEALRIGPIARFFAALMAVGLLLQAADHVSLLTDYRAPRAHGWIITMASLNGCIWSLFIKSVKGRAHANG